MRIALAVAVVLAILSASLAIELPKPPDGFAWHEVQSIQGALLVPDGWHFREEAGKGTLVFFITERPFTLPDRYLVGVSINVFLGNPDAPAQVEQHLRAQADHYDVEVEPGQFGPFLTLQCQYDLPKTAEHDVIRVVHLGVVNPETNASYLVMFESPVDDWLRTWPKGKIVIKTLALNAKV